MTENWLLMKEQKNDEKNEGKTTTKYYVASEGGKGRIQTALLNVAFNYLLEKEPTLKAGHDSRPKDMKMHIQPESTGSPENHLSSRGQCHAATVIWGGGDCLEVSEDVVDLNARKALSKISGYCQLGHL